MRVFVTGASGFIGSAIVQELFGAGHQVLGLARSDASAQALLAAGAQVHRGDLTDLDSLRRAAAETDGIIHAGFNHDFTKRFDFAKFKESAENDRQAIEAMGAALAGTSKPLVVTSALALLPRGRLVTEADRAPAGSPNPRVASEEAVDAVAAQGVRVAAVRLPPSVHGPSDQGGFVPSLINIARAKGASVYQGDGANCWPAVHRLDAARLYRLVLEDTSFSPGDRYHAAAEVGVPMRDIAGRIGRYLHLPVESKSPEEVTAHFGGFAHFATLDAHASSEQTRQQLGWQPTHPSLLADLDSGSYFA